MKRLFSPERVSLTVGIVAVLTLVKLAWSAFEWMVLPVAGEDYIPPVRQKALYYPVRLIPPAGKKPAPLTPKPVKPQANIKSIELLAIYHAEDTDVVTIRAKGKIKVIGRGETVEGFTLVGGGNDYAVFEKDGKRYRVDMVKPKKGGNANAIEIVPPAEPENAEETTSPDDASDGIVDTGDRVVVRRDLLNRYTRNLNDVYKNIGLTEVRGKKGIDGFRVTFIRRGSPFAKLGLRKGDILTAVNGEKLDSYRTAFEAYKNVTNAEDLTLTIRRGNKEMELNYEID